MFTYNISKNASEKEFNKACANIEENLKDIKKEDIIQDVDGSKIQIYTSEKGKIKVYDDYEVDAVYIDSEVNLDKIFFYLFSVDFF